MIAPFCTCVWFRGGSVPCPGARASCAASPRTDPSIPGVAAPVPCALPRATEPGRPTACLPPPPFRRESGGTPTVKRRAVQGAIPRPRQGSKLGSRGCQSPSGVVRRVMIAARTSLAMKHTTRRRETRWRAMLQSGFIFRVVYGVSKEI